MKAIIALSGGMDSATLLAYVLDKEFQVEGVAFSYGSKHGEFELKAIVDLAVHYKIPLRILDLSPIMANVKSNLLIGGGPIPEGHYEAESMKQTVVPGRNMIFISILTGIAWSEDAEVVFIGCHAGDHAIYPDCRPNFFGPMGLAIYRASDGRVRLDAPFLTIDKGEILKIGTKLNVPYHLSRTCYKAQSIACGKCGACQERLLAFKSNGLVDPIPYEDNR